MRFRNTAVVLSASAVLLCVSAFAQQSDAQSKEETAAKQTQTARHAAWISNDHMLASCVAVSNQEEIAIAKFAEERTKNSQVREFAQQLQKDHGAFLQKLKQYAPEAAADEFLSREVALDALPRSESILGNKTETTTKANGRTTVTKTQTGTVAEAAKAPINPLTLQQEVAQQCLANTQKMLTDKGADKFDACFLGHQIVMHAAMKTKLQVFERHASGELAELFADAGKTMTAHMGHAEELMEQIAHAHAGDAVTTTKEKSKEKVRDKNRDKDNGSTTDK